MSGMKQEQGEAALPTGAVLTTSSVMLWAQQTPAASPWLSRSTRFTHQPAALPSNPHGSSRALLCTDYRLHTEFKLFSQRNCPDKLANCWEALPWKLPSNKPEGGGSKARNKLDKCLNELFYTNNLLS